MLAIIAHETNKESGKENCGMECSKPQEHKTVVEINAVMSVKKSKVSMQCKARISYLVAGEIHLQCQPGVKQEVNQGVHSHMVKSLAKNWLRSGRNVVTDSFFTSFQLTEDLYVDRTTLVGTNCKSKPDIPKQLTTKEQSSIVAFSGNLTLIFYVPKKASE